MNDNQVLGGNLGRTTFLLQDNLVRLYLSIVYAFHRTLIK